MRLKLTFALLASIAGSILPAALTAQARTVSAHVHTQTFHDRSPRIHDRSAHAHTSLVSSRS